MANTVQDAKARASLLQMAQVWLRLAQRPRRQEATRSRGQVRAFRIGLPGELLPSLRHFLQDPALLLGLCLLRQTAAFLREALIFG